jgi:hypothetical protein
MREEFYNLLERLSSETGRVRWDDFRYEFLIAMTDDRIDQAEKEFLLWIYLILFGGLEKKYRESPNKLRKIRADRRDDYGYVLLNEAIDEDGRIDPMKWSDITTREVAAGHLSEDDPIHGLALRTAGYVRAGRHRPSGARPSATPRPRWFGWLLRR